MDKKVDEKVDQVDRDFAEKVDKVDKKVDKVERRWIRRWGG